MENTEPRIAPSPEAASDDFVSPFNFSPAEERAYWRGVADGVIRAGGAVPPEIAARITPPADPAAPGEALPWEADPPEEEGRRRHDAFTGARKQAFLKTLTKVGCIADACRLTGISTSTVYNHQSSDPEFERHCELALGMASTPIELTAYERAVVGHEEPVIRGGKVVGTRIRRSDYMLKILLQGSNPKKYGPRPGFKRKRLLKFERKQIEREVAARMQAQEPTIAAVRDEVLARLRAIRAHRQDKRLEQGWTDAGGGVLVPPGWVWTGEGDPRDAMAGAVGNHDAVSSSSNSSTSAPDFPPPDIQTAPPGHPC
jgi:hypothetical protein